MFKKKYKPFFVNKTCNICGKKAIMFRVIDNKHYLLCDSKKCDFIVRTRHGWHEPLVGK